MSKAVLWLSVAAVATAGLAVVAGCAGIPESADRSGGSAQTPPKSSSSAGQAAPAVSPDPAGSPDAAMINPRPPAPTAPVTATSGAKTFNDGNDPALNKTPAGQVCARLAQIQCAGEAYCCDNPGRDQATCEATMRAGCINKLYLDSITQNPVAGFDAARAEAAFAKFEQTAKTCDPNIAGMGAAPDGLMSMLRGTLASGDTCGPPLSLDKASAAAQLVSCLDGSTTACLPESPLNWTCAPKGGVGASCFSDLNCHTGLYCPNPNAQFNVSTCTERKAPGSSCQLPNECASLACKGGTCPELSVQSAYCLAS